MGLFWQIVSLLSVWLVYGVIASFFVKNNQTWSSISMSGSENGALVGTVTVSGTITIPSGSTFVIL